MKETIGIRLTELASQFVDFYFSEAQEEKYPYAVYDMTVTPVYTKDGIHHYQASVTIEVYAKNLSDCDSIADSIDNAIADNMRGDQYSSFKLSDSKECSEETWSRTMSYTIKQIR